MKTKFTPLNPLFILLLLAGFLIPVKSIAQPTLNFSDPVLISGTDKQVGAVYLFSRVKTGVDARVTYLYISPGATVHEEDGGSGFKGALQPGLTVSPYTRAYLEMSVEFLREGTNTPLVQPEVSVTCLDVDGTGKANSTNRLNEFNEVNLGGGYMDYQLNGTELSVVQSGNWVIGSNLRGVEYTQRDTSAKQVMFTAVNSNISSCLIRVGVDNQKSRTEKRQASVYFKKFNYPNAVLASSSLVSFRGVNKNKSIELLWKIEQSNNVRSIAVERATKAMKFVEINEVKVDGESTSQVNYSFIDHAPEASTQLYRLKMTATSGEIHYSNILVFRLENETGRDFGIYPNVIQNTMNMQITTDKAATALVQITDYSGRVMMQTNVLVHEGSNNIALHNMSALTKGGYVVFMRVNNTTFTKKIIKQ